MGIDPNQLAQLQQMMQQQPPQDAQSPAGQSLPQAGMGESPASIASSKVLELIIWAAGRKEEVNLDLLAGAINTFASAYKSLTEQQAAGDPPQLLEMEMHKAAQEMELKQKEADLKEQMFEIDKAMKIHEMQLKEDAHDAAIERANQEQTFKQGLSEQEQQHKQELSNATLSSQHEIGMTKAQQQPKAKPSTSS